MSDHPYRILREARPPRRHHGWFYRNAWTIPAGLCVAFGVFSLFDQQGHVGVGFLLAGGLIAFAFSGLE